MGITNKEPFHHTLTINIRCHTTWRHITIPNNTTACSREDKVLLAHLHLKMDPTIQATPPCIILHLITILGTCHLTHISMAARKNEHPYKKTPEIPKSQIRMPQHIRAHLNLFHLQETATATLPTGCLLPTPTWA